MKHPVMSDADAAFKSIPNEAEVNLNHATGVRLDTHLEVYEYTDRYDEHDLRYSLPQVRLETLHTQRKRGTGESDCVRFQPDYQFILASHARALSIKSTC